MPGSKKEKKKKTRKIRYFTLHTSICYNEHGPSIRPNRCRYNASMGTDNGKNSPATPEKKKNLFELFDVYCYRCTKPLFHYC